MEISAWEELRRDARKLESDLDLKLSSYAKLSSTLVNGGYKDRRSAPDDSWKSMEAEIDSLLKKLLAVNDAMSRITSEGATTTSVTQKLARHRDILHEFNQEFKRTRGNIQSIREHAELLRSSRDDVTVNKASGTLSPEASLLRERSAIYGNINQLDEVINQAHATRGALLSQRNIFVDIQGRLKHLGDQFPAIRGILGAIKRKKSKDTIILSAVIAVCTLFLIIYWLSK